MSLYAACKELEARKTYDEFYQEFFDLENETEFNEDEFEELAHEYAARNTFDQN